MVRNIPQSVLQSHPDDHAQHLNDELVGRSPKLPRKEVTHGTFAASDMAFGSLADTNGPSLLDNESYAWCEDD
eukprot:9178365-Pyramimonas_sp.AAC.1